jgi:hypothetical protein
VPADRGAPAGRDWRAITFRVAAAWATAVLLAAGGVFSLQVPWGSPGRLAASTAAA